MPNPSFVPIIGSGFDQVAAQQQGYINLNQRTDEGNAARLSRAQENWNAYLQSLAQTDQQQARYEDQTATAAQNRDFEIANQAQRNAENKRQFDIGAGLQKEHLKAQEKQWEFNKSEKDRAEQQQVDQTVNAGKRVAPEYNRAAQALKKAKDGWNESQKEINTVAHEAEANDLKGVKQVVYDERSMTFRHAQKGMSLSQLPPEDLAKVHAAQAKVDAAKSAKQDEAVNYQSALKEFQTWQGDVKQYGFIPQQNKDGSWSLYHPHPKINRTFGGQGKDTGDATPLPPFNPTPSTAMTGPPMRVGNVTFGATPRAALPSSSVGTVSFRPPGVPPPPPSGQLSVDGAKVGFQPPPPRVLTPPELGFEPQNSDQFWKNLSQMPAAGLRAANYVLAGPHSKEEPGDSLSVSGAMGAAVGDPNQWIPQLSPDRVRVRAPGGKYGSIPKDQLPTALSQGYKLAPLEN